MEAITEVGNEPSGSLSGEGESGRGRERGSVEDCKIGFMCDRKIAGVSVSGDLSGHNCLNSPFV
jgi:hypothetical protein